MFDVSYGQLQRQDNPKLIKNGKANLFDRLNIHAALSSICVPLPIVMKSWPYIKYMSHKHVLLFMV